MKNNPNFLARQADVEAFFAAEQPRYVVLAAAKVGGIHANSTFPADFIAANLQIQILRGVALQLAAIAFEATRLVLIQILLTSKGIWLNPITSLDYVAPCCLAFLVVPWVFVELPRLRAVGTFQPDLFVFGTNSLCAFTLDS